MRKTTFAGLTVLEPADPASTDGFAFQDRDRDTIDRFLGIGCVFHRHDGHMPLSNPQVGASGVSSSTGGTIPADVSLAFCFTMTDTEGGETLPCPIGSVTTPSPLETPNNAPSAVADYSAGSLLINTYYYGVTLLDDAGGETPLSPQALVARDPGFASGRVLVSGLSAIAAATPGSVAWRLYRAIGAGTFQYLASGGAATDGFVDDGHIAADCGIHPPRDSLNTTNSENSVTITLPGSGQIPQSPLASGIRLYIGEAGDFSDPALFVEVPVASAGHSFLVETLATNEGSPPDVSTCVHGANKIDPDKELLDWHWKRPVATAADLPAGEDGDVRVVKATGLFWVFHGGSWSPGGTGGSGTVRTVEDVHGHVALGPAVVRFQGSGGADAVVSSVGGSAVVTITAAGGSGGGGGGGGVPGTSTDWAVATLGPRWDPTSTDVRWRRLGGVVWLAGALTPHSSASVNSQVVLEIPDPDFGVDPETLNDYGQNTPSWIVSNNDIPRWSVPVFAQGNVNVVGFMTVWIVRTGSPRKLQVWAQAQGGGLAYLPTWAASEWIDLSDVHWAVFSDV